MAIIMDGNGRWAQARGLPRIDGHREGAEAVRRTTRACRRLGLPALTLYAFSEQNWNRPPDEVQALMELLRDYVINERSEIMDNGIRLTAIGRRDRLPQWVLEPLEELIKASETNQDMELCLAISYGGREELTSAIQQLGDRMMSGNLKPQEVDPGLVDGLLWTCHLPPLDFLVRTSGELRLSNFLLWQAAYAELYFTETFWPDFDIKDLLAALEDYAARERRYGLTGDQVGRGGDPET